MNNKCASIALLALAAVGSVASAAGASEVTLKTVAPGASALAYIGSDLTIKPENFHVHIDSQIQGSTKSLQSEGTFKA